MTTSTADYVVVGGGLTGGVIAARLAQSPKKPKVALLEAAKDHTGDERITTPLGGMLSLFSELDYAYESEPTSTTFDRVHKLNAGKALGGGTVINFGGWLRGNAYDYDLWAATVNDNKWSYEGLLPYMRKSENYLNKKGNPKYHGFEGPVAVAPISEDRTYPLREPILKAWQEVGHQYHAADKHDGSIAGINDVHENSSNGQRQTSYSAYGIDGVDVHTEALVHRILFDSNKKATGVELSDGRIFHANKEVILCAGTYRTPQILMLSGVGPSSVLEEHNIPIIHESPNVGSNLHDHFCTYLGFKLKDPERRLALPLVPGTESPYGIPNPTGVYSSGLAWDYIINIPYTNSQITQHTTKDSGTTTPYETLLSSSAKPHTLIETFALYLNAGLPGIPMDGSHICTSTMLLLPTSRGHITLRSSSPSDPPRIYPNYFTTPLDRFALTDGVRQTLRALLSTSALAPYIDSEVPLSGDGIPAFEPLGPDSSDAQIEERIRATGAQHHHSGGTAAMGSVCDVEGRVQGVQGVRVADASLVPVPVGGHPQATLYAMAERLAEGILEGL